MSDKSDKNENQKENDSSSEDKNFDSQLNELMKFYSGLGLTPRESKKTNNGKKCQDNNETMKDTKQSPSKALLDTLPRQSSCNSKSAEQLTKTTETFINSGGSKSVCLNKKLNEVYVSSGDAEGGTSDKFKTRKKTKKTRFASEVEVLYYNQDSSGDQFHTIEPLADETDQQQRSYTKRFKMTDVAYPRSSFNTLFYH